MEGPGGERHRPEAATPRRARDLRLDEAGGLLPDAAPTEHEPVEPLATPEAAFAARVPPPAPVPALPPSRRAIFFDVENTSHPADIARVIEHLALDRGSRRTELVAVGNWRVIGAETARLLAHHGAQLVHSAPSSGVRDWSDLRIAVSAGVWLAGARPGDVLEVVSADRAFDAVGDVAAALGIAFRRLSSRALAGAPGEAPGEAERAGTPRRGRRRRGGRRTAAGPRRTEARLHEPAPAAQGVPQTAPHDELLHVVRELAERSSDGAVLLDTLERSLKARGFSRPPGSPRLVTRLRRIKDIALSPTGRITLVGEPALAGPRPAAAGEAHAGGPVPARGRRRSGRRSRGRRPGKAASA